jgi:hypothetical protein
MTEGTVTHRTRTRTRSTRFAAACAVVGMLAGVGVFVVPRAFDSAGAARPYALDREHSVAALPRGLRANSELTTTTTPAPLVSPTVKTPTPVDGLHLFLDARVAGNNDDAWRAVSDRDHRQFPTAVDWEDANGELPHVTGYTLGAPDASGDRGEVPGTVSYVPTLDEIGGNVPAIADVTWAVVHEAGNWHVSLAESEVRARRPADSGAVTAARRWAAAREQCATAAQWRGEFLGNADDRGARLCHATGAVDVGGVRELDDTDDAEPFLAAFGGDVFSWARVVAVSGPAQFDLVLAPIGDQWFAIGAIASSSRSSG